MKVPTSLTRAIKKSDEKRVRLVHDRRKAIREFAGFYWGGEGTDEKRPDNQLQQTIQIMMRLIASGVPRAWVRPRGMVPPYVATAFQENINNLLDKIAYQNTLNRVKFDAMMYGGHVKIGFDLMADAARPPFCDYISFEDWVQDFAAKSWETQQFRGDRYRLPMWFLEANKDRYDPEAVKRLKGYQYNQYSQGRIGGEPKEEDEYKRTVEVMDLYLPQEGKLLTTDCTGEYVLTLAADFKGFPEGPYDRLTYIDVVDSTVPVSLIHSLIDMNSFQNFCWNRTMEDTRDGKELTIFPRGATTDKDAIANEPHRGAVGLDNPAAIKKEIFGGPQQALLALMLHNSDTFNKRAGNPDSYGGLAPQSNTLGQDQLTAASSSQQITEMAATTVQFVRRNIKRIAWYMWRDQKGEYVTTDESGDVHRFGAEDRVGKELDYAVDIHATSLEYQTPQGLADVMTKTLLELGVPAAPMMAAQGQAIDWGTVFQDLSKLRNMPEFQKWIVKIPPPEEGAEGPKAQPAQKPSGERTYQRVSRSVTPAGREAIKSMQSAGAEA